jgi:hypothetical protein
MTTKQIEQIELLVKEFRNIPLQFQDGRDVALRVADALCSIYRYQQYTDGPRMVRLAGQRAAE